MAERHRRRQSRSILILSALALGLAACAPAPVVNERTELSAADQTAICAGNPRVTDRGVLLYGAPGAESSVPPDYVLECPNLRIRAEGLTVTVQAPTVAQALATFDEDAYLLGYFADLRVRVDGNALTADPVTGVPDNLQNDAKTVTVTVTPQGGEARPLLQRGVVTPVTLTSGTAYRIDIRARDTANPWPTVLIDPASGTVTATMAR